jgi:hypothetical protein
LVTTSQCSGEVADEYSNASGGNTALEGRVEQYNKKDYHRSDKL